MRLLLLISLMTLTGIVNAELMGRDSTFLHLTPRVHKLEKGVTLKVDAGHAGLMIHVRSKSKSKVSFPDMKSSAITPTGQKVIMKGSHIKNSPCHSKLTEKCYWFLMQKRYVDEAGEYTYHIIVRANNMEHEIIHKVKYSYEIMASDKFKSIEKEAGNN